MAKTYKGSFDYTAASDSYTCRMGGFLIPWWVWLIAGIILLFIASLFIRWNHTLTVQVVDELNHPIENADVAVNYTARFCPWIKKDVALKGQTDFKGETRITNMPVSVWSWLFYHRIPVEVKAAKGPATDSKTVPLHPTEKVVLRLKTPAQNISFEVRTVDAFTGNPVAGAELLLTVDGDGRPGHITTGPDGKATISGVTDRNIISVAARHPDYNSNDSTIYQVPGLDLRDKATDIPLIPKVKCNEQIAHTTLQEHAEVPRIDLGAPDVDFLFTYYTDAYPDHIRVYDENGRLIKDFGNIATNTSELTERLHSPTRYIKVTVDTYDHGGGGSNWHFTVGCP